MARPTQVIINTAAMQHNLQQVKRYAPHSKILAMVKANGYGHGIAACIKAFAAADAFGVACLEEAQAIRAAGCDKRVVLQQGVFSAEELQTAQQLQLDIVVHCAPQIALLQQNITRTPLNCWLKINTGMNRLGFAVTDAAAAWQALQNISYLKQPPILMTHFANADQPGHSSIANQLQQFRDFCVGKTAAHCLANSAAIMSLPETHGDWVRPGLMLYGIAPFANKRGADYGLQPAMTVRSEIIAQQQCAVGSRVGYGGRWECTQNMPIGVVPIGYADGYPRHANDTTPVSVNGVVSHLAGRVSMDMLTVNLLPCTDATIGAVVELWGAEVPVERVAACADTIPYELCCAIAPRVRRVMV